MDSLSSRIAEAIRQNDYEAYQNIRYPHIPDGEEVVFDSQDFSGVDFAKFGLGFFVLEGCNLDRAKALRGQPITIKDCSARGLDLSGVSAVINAIDSDFTGMKFDEATVLARPENGRAGCSEFVDCRLDSATREYFERQGVRILEGSTD